MLEVKPPKAVFGIRHVQALLLFFGQAIGFAMKVNMSMAIVAMTDPAAENTFNWSLQTQSVILSSFFWASMVLQIPGGLLADKVGGKLFLVFSIGCNSIITLILPAAATYGGWQAVCACRVLQGLTQGFLLPCTHNLISKWAPLKERSRFSAFVYSGLNLGTAAQLMLAGFLADYWGWPSIFYASGICGLVWTVLFICFAASSPQDSKRISEEERQYIQSSLGHVGGHQSFAVPWKSMFTSLPLLAVIIANCCQNWGYFTLMTEIPSYMSQVLGMNIKTNGVMSALPYLTKCLFAFPFGLASDFVLARGWLSTSATRKLCNSIAFFGAGVALLGLAYVPAGHITLAVGLLCLVLGINAATSSGFMLIHLDIAPNFAGTMLGIANFFATFSSVFAPLAAGAIIQDEKDAGEWRKVFYLSSLIYFIGNTIFLIFATSERQPWNEPKQEKGIENGSNSNAKEKTEKVV